MAPFPSWLTSHVPLTWKDSAARDLIDDYVKWPFLLLAGSSALVAGFHYGGWALANKAAGEIDYLTAKWEFAQGRDGAALSSIQAALTHSRTDAATWKLAASISERQNSAEAAYCWQQADGLEPGSFSIQLSLAEAALKSNQLDLAAAALAEVAENNRPGERFLLMAAQMAEARGDSAEEDRRFAELEKLRSRHPRTTLALASWEARSSNPAEARRGVDRLRSLLTVPEIRPDVLRSLIAVARRTGDGKQALIWSDGLLVTSQSTWSDRLQRLDLLSGEGRAAWRDSLMAQAPKAGQIAALADWLVSDHEAEKALIWIREQPEERQGDVVVEEARARCLEALGLWEHLREIQQADFWPGREPARLMYLSEALGHLGDETGARGIWARAVFSCQTYGDFQELRDQIDLNKTSSMPGLFWADARTFLLDHMAAAYPGEAGLVRALLHDAKAARDSVRIENCWERLASLDPHDSAAEAHWNQLSLLRNVRIVQASAAIARLRHDDPSDPDVLTASAFSLYRQGCFREAAEALGELNAGEIDAPERAVYVGSILALTGATTRARLYLEAALREPGLLREERALAQNAQGLIDYRTAMSELGRRSSRPGLPQAETNASSLSASLSAVVQSVELSATGHRDRAADLLGDVNVEQFGVAENLAYLGGILHLVGEEKQAQPYLELDSNLPEEPALRLEHRALEAWWRWQGKAAKAGDAARGLFAVYQGLEKTETDAGFWRADAPRELSLIRTCLLRGSEVEGASARLEALLRHLSFSAETEAVSALAAFRRGQFQAAARRLQELPAEELKRPETALYYGVVLESCGRNAEAKPFLQLAFRSKLSPEDKAFFDETSALP